MNHLSVERRLLIIVGMALLLSFVILEVVTIRTSANSFRAVIGGFETSIGTVEASTKRNFQGLAKAAQQDLAQQIRIMAGESLQPGESAKFYHLVGQLSALKDLNEVSYFGDGKTVELSSIKERIGKEISPALWEEALRTRRNITREGDDGVSFYEPLFADADILRFHPGWKAGHMYGILQMRFSKDRFAVFAAAERQQSEEMAKAVREGRRIHNEANTRALWTILAFMAVYLVLAVFILRFIIRRSIIAPLGRLQSHLDTIASGEADLTKRIPVATLSNGKASQDELTHLGATFNRFLDQLQELIRRVGLTTGRVSASTGELGTLARRLTSDAGEVRQQSGASLKSVNDVTGDLQTVSAAIEEMIASISEVSQRAQEAARTAAEALARSHEAETAIGELQQSSATINDILAVITSIAAQTNLLALNATIEAARAGDAGRGFAVVASEVKELARQSSSAATDIQTRLTAMNAALQRVATAHGGIMTSIENVDKANASIAAVVEEQTATNREIGRTVTAATDHTGRIKESMASLTTTTASTAEGARSAESAADNLAGASRDLTELVGKFRI